MNTAMMMHPATQEAFTRLKNWGVTVLEPGLGRLACGDVGYGKMSDPEEIAEMIKQKLYRVDTGGTKKGKVLITSGGTREKIDEAREISNISTGSTGAAIASCFISNHWDVTLLHAINSRLPGSECKKVTFTDFDSLEKMMEQLLRENDFNAVIHLAAVSDYSVKAVLVDGIERNAPFKGKIDSHSDELVIKLRKNHKILHGIKQKAGKNDLVLVAFKFTAGEAETTIRKKIALMMEKSGADLVVWNDADSRTKGRQTGYNIFNNMDRAPEKCPEASTLAERLEKILSEKIKNN
jgi:phosphopantothenoylcysteine decarboxylase/phosphopantothenate--cysteine ligase